MSTKNEYTMYNEQYSDYSLEELRENDIIDVNNILSPLHDVATKNFGGSWRIPTRTEFQELISECTWVWTQVNDVNGYKVTGPNRNSIFLPATGFRYSTGIEYGGAELLYWTSIPDDRGGSYALRCVGEESRGVVSVMRYNGYTVRPVLRTY